MRENRQWVREGDRNVLRTEAGVHTVSMIDGGRTGLYYDVVSDIDVRTTPHEVVLLGVGGGEMLRQAGQRWPHAVLIGIDTVVPSMPPLNHFLFGQADGREWITRQMSESLDMLLVDMFDDEGNAPAGVQGYKFIAQCYRTLKPGGVLIINTWKADTTELHTSLRETFGTSGFLDAAEIRYGENSVWVVYRLAALK